MYDYNICPTLYRNIVVFMEKFSICFVFNDNANHIIFLVTHFISEMVFANFEMLLVSNKMF